MPIRFLLFRGRWEYEGLFYALETESTIIIFSAGQDFSSTDSDELEIGKDYLKERRKKIAGIVISNTDPRHISLLDDLCCEIGFEIPIYTSYHSKLILNTVFPKIKNKINIVEKEEHIINDIVISFLPCSSYIVGALAVACHYSDFSFYFVEETNFSLLTENKLLSPVDFFSQLVVFFATKRSKTYLVAGCQDISWLNDNSLFLIKNDLINFISGTPFFIFYYFDWLHIFELLELMQSWKKRVIFIKSAYEEIFKKILFNSRLKNVVYDDGHQEFDSNSVYLLIVSPEDSIIDRADYFLKKIEPNLKFKIKFTLALYPIIGGEAKMAYLTDWLHTQSDTVINIGKNKKQYFRLGISFADLQLVIKLLKPNGTIILNNSYKSKDILSHLPGRLIFMNNNHYWDGFNRKTAIPTNKKTLISLEEILIEQREQLKQTGLLIIYLMIVRNQTKLELKKVHLEKIAIVLAPEDADKLENKIKKWWESKLIFDIEINLEPIKNIKTIIERRLSALIKKFINYEYGKELTAIPILSFF